MRNKKKSICIVGMQYDMAMMPIEEVKKDVQADLDYIYGEGNVQFDMNDKDGNYHLLFKRRYGEFYCRGSRTSFNGEKYLFSEDAKILFGTMRKKQPTVVDFQSWENAYIHYLSLSEVLDEYKKVSKSWGSMKVKSLDVEEHDGEVEFVVGF